MTKQLIGSTFSDPPFHYGGGEEWLRSLLVAIDKAQLAKDAVSSGAEPQSKQTWEASASLQLVGGVPGDDWSIFPVHEVLKATYSIRTGLSTLSGARVLAEW